MSEERKLRKTACSKFSLNQEEINHALIRFIWAYRQDVFPQEEDVDVLDALRNYKVVAKRVQRDQEVSIHLYKYVEPKPIKVEKKRRGKKK